MNDHHDTMTRPTNAQNIAAQLDAERYARVPGYIVICATKSAQC